MEHFILIELFFFVQNSSDLLSLIQVMIVTFGEHPPVYSKPKEQVTPYPTSCKQFHEGHQRT